MRKTYGVWYQNLGDHAIGVAAVATYYNEELMDWAAYIGATDNTHTDQAAYDCAASNGNKLTEREAEFFTVYYRDILPINKYRP